MDELISRQSVIDAFGQGFKDATDGLDKFSPTRGLIEAVTGIYKCYIKQLPSIQPEPHIGHWKPVGMAEAVGGESAMWGSAIAYHECSECGEQALEENGEEKLSDFCPHCGADMRGEHDG